LYRVNRKVVKVKECKQSVLRLRLPRAHALQECLPRTILKGTWSQIYLNQQQLRKIQEIKTKHIEMITVETVSYISYFFFFEYDTFYIIYHRRYIK